MPGRQAWMLECGKRMIRMQLSSRNAGGWGEEYKDEGE